MNALKLKRLLSNKTQDQLMAETGIHQTKISRIERGFRQPSIEEITLLAQALNCKPEDIFLRK